MKKAYRIGASLLGVLLLVACGGQAGEAQSATSQQGEASLAASTATAPPGAEVQEPEPLEEDEGPDIPHYEMAYHLLTQWENEYEFEGRVFLLDMLPQTDAEAAVAMYWYAQQSGEFVRWSYLWQDGMDLHWQISIDNAYDQREEKATGFASIQVQKLVELTREETIEAWNGDYDEPMLQRYYESSTAKDSYEDWVAALYNAGTRLVFLRLNTEYFPATAALAPQYPDGIREMVYLTGFDENGNRVLISDSYGYSILMPNPGDEALSPATSTAP